MLRFRAETSLTHGWLQGNLHLQRGRPVVQVCGSAWKSELEPEIFESII